MSAWKPGDVGVCKYGRVFYSGDKERGSWTFDDGSGGFGLNFFPRQTHEPSGLRLLVVIDPGEPGSTDRVDVDRLDSLLWSLGYDSEASYLERYTILDRALREFANPKPRIEEPQGRLAVVKDSGGDEWCHVGEGVWRSLTSTGAYMVEKHWHDLDTPLAESAVEIVSEGVTE